MPFYYSYDYETVRCSRETLKLPKHYGLSKADTGEQHARGGQSLLSTDLK